MNDSNPGKINITYGGVGHNIAVNMAKLSVNTSMISVVGNDALGQAVMEATRLEGVNTDGYMIKEGSTPMYVCFLEQDGDMAIAMSHMALTESLSMDDVLAHQGLIEKAKGIVLDANLSSETLLGIVKAYPDKLFFVDPVSAAKSERIEKLLPYIHTLKPNQVEVEALTGIEMTDEASMNKAVDWFLSKGVKRVFMSLGSEGVYYGSESERGLFVPEKVKPVSATGAGDAFMAGLVASYEQGLSMKEQVAFASLCSRLTLLDERTMSDQLNLRKVLTMMGDR